MPGAVPENPEPLSENREYPFFCAEEAVSVWTEVLPAGEGCRDLLLLLHLIVFL